MKQTKLIMGMPITVEIIGEVEPTVLEQVFELFRTVDARFSTYKVSSEISKVNRGLPKSQWSREMREVMELCDATKSETNGFFDIEGPKGLDPSGLVKGWAINKAAQLLKKLKHMDFYIDAGGDVAISGSDADSEDWTVGIRNPFNAKEIVKVLKLTDRGVATSGSYIRGPHIYNPKKPQDPLQQVASLSVVGPNIYEADRFATAAFAMGPAGIDFIASSTTLEAYMITSDNKATYTNGIRRYFADV